MKGSGSVKIIMDPDPRGPKIYGSGTLLFNEGGHAWLPEVYEH